uniref:EGF-like domain-containing protein n=1 Tax=Magallana gigas TaxID=29159 RepID=A0A8W8L9K5_MAGGI
GVVYISDEVPQRICWQQPCKNSGVCVDDANGYTCQCPYLFNGTNCENDLSKPLLYTGIYSPLFYFRPFRLCCHQVNLKLGEF